MKHLFAICAYGVSPYLEECVASLEKQTEPSEIILCTATPDPALERIAAAHGLTYCVNPAKPDIASDWNFAMAQAKRLGADYVTLCHQDDLYLPDYGKHLRAAINEDPDWLIWFSDYGERRGDRDVTVNRNLRIKRVLLWRMRVRRWQSSRFMKHRTLALGDPVCCPAVSYNLRRVPLPLFESGMTTNLDWQTWERLAKLDGRFFYDRAVLMLHRIHPASTTSKVLGEGGRTAQDEAMFRKFWPAPVAKLLTRFYAASEKSNET